MSVGVEGRGKGRIRSVSEVSLEEMNVHAFGFWSVVDEMEGKLVYRIITLRDDGTAMMAKFLAGGKLSRVLGRIERVVGEGEEEWYFRADDDKAERVRLGSSF